MQNSKRGFSSGLTIKIIIIVAALCIGFVYIINNVGEDKFDEMIKNVEDYASDMIMEIEEEGYITEELEFEALEFLEDNNIRNSKIEGTKDKVETNEKVFLAITIEIKDTDGNVTKSKRISEKGIAK